MRNHITRGWDCLTINMETTDYEIFESINELVGFEYFPIAGIDKESCCEFSDLELNIIEIEAESHRRGIPVTLLCAKEGDNTVRIFKLSEKKECEHEYIPFQVSDLAHPGFAPSQDAICRKCHHTPNNGEKR